MTEIKIEKKSAVWPWILLGLGILALLIYLLFSYTHNESVETNFETNNTEGTKLINVRENNSTVAAFVSFVNNDTNKMSLDHSYTNAALLKLTQAIEAMAAETGYNVRADVDKAKEYTNKITHDPSETTHADNIRKAADILSASLQNMQQAKYPELATEAEELRRAAASIDPGVLTLDQKDAVRSFFGKAANLLQKMN
jgi:CHASE3 domain sensor protein